MPPKKSSDVSKVVTGDETTPAKDPVRDGVNIEDYNLPKSIVNRLAKGVLPPNTQIQGNAMLAMTKGATVFVNYLATHANEFAQREGRKTLTPNDVFRALEELEFPEFKPRLEAELAKFNDIQTDKRNTYKNKVAANKAQGKTTSPQPEEDGDGEPAAKKARREEGEEMPESYALGRENSEGEGEEEEAQDDEEDDGEEDTLEVDEHVEGNENEEREEEEENEDEALDNGDDSD